MKIKFDPTRALTLLSHGVNFSWIFHVLFLKYKNQRGEINYLADPVNLALIAISVILNIACWRVLSRDPVKVVFRSGIELHVAMRVTAKEWFARFFYLIKPIPNDRVIEQYVRKAFEKRREIEIKTKADLIALLLDIKNLKFIYALTMFIAVGALAAGESLNYGVNIKNIWFLIPIFMCLLISVLIHSVSVFVFFLIFIKFRG